MFSFMDCCSFCASECQHIALSHNSFMYFFLAKLSNKQQFFFLLFFSPEVHLHIFSTAVICLFAFRALLIFFFCYWTCSLSKVASAGYYAPKEKKKTHITYSHLPVGKMCVSSAHWMPFIRQLLLYQVLSVSTIHNLYAGGQVNINMFL